MYAIRCMSETSLDLPMSITLLTESPLPNLYSYPKYVRSKLKPLLLSAPKFTLKFPNVCTIAFPLGSSTFTSCAFALIPIHAKNAATIKFFLFILLNFSCLLNVIFSS